MECGLCGKVLEPFEGHWMDTHDDDGHYLNTYYVCPSHIENWFILTYDLPRTASFSGRG